MHKGKNVREEKMLPIKLFKSVHLRIYEIPYICIYTLLNAMYCMYRVLLCKNMCWRSFYICIYSSPSFFLLLMFTLKFYWTGYYSIINGFFIKGHFGYFHEVCLFSCFFSYYKHIEVDNQTCVYAYVHTNVYVYI